MSSIALRHIAQQMAIIGMEACAFASVAYLAGTGGTAIPWLWFIVVGWALLAFNRWLFGLAIWETAQGKLISILSGVVDTSFLMGVTVAGALFVNPLAMLLALTELPLLLIGNAPLAAALLSGMVLYYRVLVVVRQTVGSMGIAQRWLWVLGAVVWALLIMGARSEGVHWAPFIACAIFALAAYTLSRTHELDMISEVAPLPFTPRWVGIVAGGIGATLLVGLVAQFLIVTPLAGIGMLLAPLWTLLITIFVIPFRVILFLLNPLLEMMPEGTFELPQADPVEAEGPISGEIDPITTGNAEIWLHVIVVFVVVVVIAIIFQQALRRIQSARRRGAVGIPEYGNTPIQGFRNLFRFRNPFTPRADYGIETVRDLYKNLLLFGERQGISRGEETTPYEYLQPLSATNPTVQGELRSLTDAYVATHYGEISFSRDEISRLQAAWQKIKASPISNAPDKGTDAAPPPNP
jgi:hypothetical protein